MAWAEEIPGSGRWRGLYRDSSGRKRTAPDGPYNTEAKAKRAAAVAEDDARRRPGQQVTGSARLTWSTWCDLWWGRRKVEPGTLARDASRRTAHLDPRWGDVRLAAITRDQVQAWVDDLTDAGLSASTVANVYHLLSSSLKAAVLDGRLAASPCTSIALPRRPPADERFLTWEEVSAICHHLDDRDALLVWWLVGTGARWGEGVGAHRHRLHLDSSTPRLDIHEVWDQRSREVKPYPKGRTKRSVPLPRWLVGKLEEHLDGDPGRGRCGSAHRTGSRCRSPLVLPGRDGKVIDYDSWRKTRWLDACARAEVGHVRIHDLRHTYASWLLQSGQVSIEALSELMGHASIAVTQRYAHLADTQWGNVVEALNGKSAPHLPQNDHGAGGHDQNVRRISRSDGA
jgi:integrase